ncbi:MULTISPECIES: TauD/TfdA family dioxygenase [Pectobacterium]|uniref:TauD/TfdA family dioxygenase n=1 Tax=Pectobacterium TaxID=122277 RepID=UPI001BFF922B|nr:MULTISPECIES: TauD/TfdA family dioxygenase [Pectobacterium]MBT9183712.1 TauD/TfdA family dioxygenase [Pectobacterium punjabense]MCE9733336.1 hypothetical protein [Pectobacterium sp. IFB5596]
MRNGPILSRADKIRNVLPIPPDEFRKQLNEKCYVIWKLPYFNVGNITETPMTPSDVDYIESKNIDLYAAYLSAHFEAGLWPVVYQGENDGHLIRHVCPMISSGNKISSQGAKYDFYPHVDNPDLSITGEKSSKRLGNCPDTLTLLCLRKEHGVNTSLLKLDQILSILPPDIRDILAKPLFKVRRPESFSKSSSVEGVPITVNEKGVWYSRFDWHNTIGMTLEAEAALEKLRFITLERDLWFDVPLEPGDAVTFLNQRTMHTRNAFEPRFDGTDRWLLRIFGMKTRPPETQLLNPTNCLHHLRTL